MASITRKTGASGVLSPYWQAKFNGPDGRVVWLSTKLTNQKKALAVAERWERAAQLAAKWELTQERSNQILGQVSEIARNPATIDATRTLLGELLIHSIGETFKGQNFEQFCLDWLEGKSRLIAPTTLAKYRPLVHGFLEFLPQKRRTASVASITTGEIERFRSAELKSGKTASTCNDRLRILRSVFNAAHRQGIALVNPAEGVEFLPQTDSEERVPFSREQVAALLNVADRQWRGMILFGCYCGLRIGDAANLRWSNIDLVERKLSFEPQKTSRRKKPSERVLRIYLHDALVTYLEAALPNSDEPLSPIFPDLHGEITAGGNGLSHTFNRLMARAKVVGPASLAKTGKGRRVRRLSFHSLRHSFVSQLANLEVSADLRKELVGHSSDSVHDRYTHLSFDLQRLAISKLPSLRE
jgi:integrase